LIEKIISVFLLLIITCFANSEYDYKYNLTDDGSKIGTLEAKSIKIDEEIFKYTTNLNIKFSYMFVAYEYIYKT
jgi:hypothetical protein